MNGEFDNHFATKRFTGIALLLILLSLAVTARIGYTMVVKREFWGDVQKRMENDSLVIEPMRGNIISADGHKMACNLPEYDVFFDFNAMRETKADTLLFTRRGVPTPLFNQLCHGLHDIFPEKSIEEFKEYIIRGYTWKNSKGRHHGRWLLVKRRVDYLTYEKLRKLPFIKVGANRVGFGAEQRMVRSHPYGTLAYSVIGDTYKNNNVPYAGLEVKYDSLLHGVAGFRKRKKVLNKFINIADSAATNGLDVVTTIDIAMQDMAEAALRKEMIKDNAYTGVAIVMEVATGNIKAMVNLDSDGEGDFYEERNHAVADMLEPGSVFKTASIMVALEDGYIPDTARCWVDTGHGIREMYGRKMRDHNYKSGGYHNINVCRILQVSSNIGVSVIIDNNYHNDPAKFVKGIHRLGLATDLKLPFPEYHAPSIRIPEKDAKGRYWKNWSKTALPWMSIGYETMVPPISTLTFYNAIANNGKMVKPRFILRTEKDGKTVREFPVTVIKNRIASERTIGIIQDMLYKVVKFGLAKTAAINGVKVAGKTGTAQKPHNGHYAAGTDYLLSFCGYFPADAPEYSCIVCLQKTGIPASGGKMAGQVFHDIAEGIMSSRVKYDVRSSHDSFSETIPYVKAGNIVAAEYILSQLDMKTDAPWNGSYANGNPIWGTAKKNSNSVTLEKSQDLEATLMPDVKDMGATDAIYILEKKGLKVRIEGKGKVREQSIAPRSHIRKGQRVTLKLA